MLYKFTHELLYIIIDQLRVGPLYKIQKIENQIHINNFIITHYYDKMYKVNNKNYNFRDLWHFIQQINLNIKSIKIGYHTKYINNGYIDISPLNDINKNLLLYINCTGFQKGDDDIIKSIINIFL